MGMMCGRGRERAGVAVRIASGRDVGKITEVVVNVFCKEDKVMEGIRDSVLGKMKMGRWLQRLYVGVCKWEVGQQLNRRLVDVEKRSAVKEMFGKRHVVLVAVDVVEDNIVGCIEMGLVDVPKLLAGGMTSEVQQWEENIVTARLEAELSDLKMEKLRKQDDKKNMVKTPYIGNLAVALSHRRRGVGSVLVRAAQSHAKDKWDYNKVCLHVEADNMGACMLYASLGFSCELQEPNWYGGIGRIRRLFLRADGMEEKVGDVENVENVLKKWKKAATVGRKMNFVEYLRYCVWDLKRIRDNMEEEK